MNLKAERLQRVEALLGSEALERLSCYHVALFGLGGVGGYTAQALARSAVGHITLVDGDRVVPSNINRQLVANRETIGKYKTQVMQEMIEQIDPQICVQTYPVFYDGSDNSPLQGADYIIDAIDDVPAKIMLMRYALEHNIPMISSMGMGRRMDPGALAVMDISKTQMDPLAKRIRKLLREQGIEKGITVVCSSEAPLQTHIPQVMGSFAPVVGAAGLMLAAQCVQDALQKGR